MRRGAIWVGAALVALLSAGCGDEETNTPAPAAKRTELSGALAVDIRGTADVKVIVSDDKSAEVSVTLDDASAAGFAPAGQALTATGRVEAFAEADSELVVAKFSAPADASGPCKDEPVSLALSLHRRGKAARTAGSLTAYCGKDRWHGVPARIFRLSGELASK